MNLQANRPTFITDVIGKNIKMAADSKEAIQLSGLDYQVGINNATVNINGVNKVIPDKYATYREDLEIPFSTVGGRYTIVQNEKMFSIADRILDLQKAEFVTAGTLNNGAKAFMSIRLQEHDIVMPDNDDIIEFRLILSTSHDGSQSLKIAFMPIRLVCSNGLVIQDKKNTCYYTLRHTQSIDKQLDKTVKIMAERHNFVKFINNKIDEFNKIKINDNIVNSIISNLVFTNEELNLIELNNGVANNIDEISTRKLNIHSKITNSIYTGIGQDKYRGTGLWLYNGLTTYMANDKSYSSQEKKYNTIVENSNSNLINSAVKMIGELT